VEFKLRHEKDRRIVPLEGLVAAMESEIMALHDVISASVVEIPFE
jgi:hypothetical protein